FDARMSLFPTAAGDYVRVRQALEAREGTERAWATVFPEHNIRFLLFHSSELAVNARQLTYLSADVDEWVPCYCAGRTAIFAWAGPLEQRNKRPRPFARVALDFDRLAFGPDCQPAPPKGPRMAQPHPWYTELYRPVAPLPFDFGTASQHFLRFAAQRQR